MTVYDDLLVGGYLRPQGDELRSSAERMFGYFPKLRPRRDQLAGSLSGGEQQMLAIARAFHRWGIECNGDREPSPAIAASLHILRSAA